MNYDQVPQRKRMAMGAGPKPGNFKKGGSIGAPTAARVPALKTGIADSPLETSKRNNGIPGMKKGGRC